MRLLEKIIKDFDLILNNELRAIIKLKKKIKEFIIDFTFIIIELESLDL